ncbi:hypothetical protein AS9A_3736 [Hoyosella subflava DQS3-9A1]|uniref:Uncharacterized protein n=1 Tax=Hoyosella subflava (strain DSM 45089 / JCM 17490 / NBRC 109087 / DQS3-9A1) TaxID=443218 RepID=F6EF37_HOYSD|nr:hypothetical protein AS9A_3736 [Hoyosella subflava DQS3-9A1]
MLRPFTLSRSGGGSGFVQSVRISVELRVNTELIAAVRECRQERMERPSWA